MVNRMNRRLFSVLLFAVTLPAWAETPMADPTRPPVGYAVDSTEPSTPTGPVLQSVLIPRKGKPMALISGQQVRLGESFGERRLIRLSEREAVLDGPAGRERLLLTPGVEMTNITKIRVKESVARRVQSKGKP